ncbi:MAG: hypothetical protein ACPGNT_10815, partial [Rhodospirillales bacterium]
FFVDIVKLQRASEHVAGNRLSHLSDIPAATIVQRERQRRSLAGLVIVNGAMVSASALDDHRLGEGDVVELHPPHAGG